MVLPMRRRLRKFLPIVLMALLVQIFAPVAACWAATLAADPLRAPAICHESGAANSSQGDHSGQRAAHDGCCSACNLAHAGGPIDTPQGAAIEPPCLQQGLITWHDVAADRLPSRIDSQAQARAPPHLT
jgi:DUF2946 family protein